MDSPATGGKSAEQSTVDSVHHEDRNTWIFTGYAICGIVFFGVLAYYCTSALTPAATRSTMPVDFPFFPFGLLSSGIFFSSLLPRSGGVL